MNFEILFFYGIVFLLLFFFILFYLFKKGKTKTGIIICVITITFCLSLYFINEIDSFTHSKKDVIEDLNYAKIELLDSFKIIENKVTGMPERFQKTKLLISENDKNILINKIINEDNFKEKKTKCVFLCYNYSEQLLSNKYYFYNYKFNKEYIREAFFKKDNYVPIIIVISLKKETNILEYERIEN